MSKTDLELLQRVAFVMGIDEQVGTEGVLRPKVVNGATMMAQWNPLANLEDALELAAKMKFTIAYGAGSVCISLAPYSSVSDLRTGVAHATCRAIVYAVTGFEEARQAARDKGFNT